MAYSIYEAKARLSELLRRVKEGREVVISERGTPIAKVIPFRKEKSFEERIDHLESIGAILSSKRKEVPKGFSHPGGLGRFLKERD